MTRLQDVLSVRQSSLINDLDTIFKSANGAIESIRISYEFLKEAIKKSKLDSTSITLPQYSGAIYDLFESYENLISSGQIHTAAKLIPDNFGEIPQTYIDNLGNTQAIPLGMNLDSQKFFSFIYHQLFISLIATLEAYTNDLMILVFKAHPERLGDKNIGKSTKSKINFENRYFGIQISFFQGSPTKFKDLKGNEDTETIDQRIQEILRENFYGPTHKQINLLKRALLVETDMDFLMPYWANYSEMNVRRNSGLHAGWRGRQEYNTKVDGIKKYYKNGNVPYFKKNDLGFDVISHDFLGFDAEYFCRSYRTASKIINLLKQQCDLMLGQAASVIVSATYGHL